MKWEWENKVSLQRLLQKLKDADSSGAVLTKSEAKFMYDLCEDKMKILEKIRAEIDEARYIDKDTRFCKNALASGLGIALDIIDKYIKEEKER